MQSELFMNVEASFQNQADQNLPETFSQVAPTGHHKHKDPKKLLAYVEQSFGVPLQEFLRNAGLNRCDGACVLFLRNFVQVKQSDNKSEIRLTGTVKKYAQNLCMFLNYCLDSSPVDTFDVLPHNVSDYVGNEIKKGRAINTINLKIRTIRSYYKFLSQAGLMSRNPSATTRTLKGGKKCHEDHVFYPKEVQTLLSHVADKNKRDFLLLAVLRYGGLRVDEAINLTWKDLKENIAGSWWLKVTGKGNKTRMVNIPSQLADDLLRYRQDRFRVPVGAKDAPGLKDFPLFGGKRDPRRKLHYEEVYRMLRGHSQNALGKKVSPHWFRHTFVTHLLGTGMDMKVVSGIVGHGCISTTLKYHQSYHLQNGEVESAFNGEYCSVF